MEAVKLTEVLDKIGPTQNPLSGRCENCDYGIKYRDTKGQRKWCKRCIDVYSRMNKLSNEAAERKIFRIVGALYIDAKISDLSSDTQAKLLNFSRRDNIFFFGPVGTGKTYAMASLVRKYIYLGYDCIRINFDDFCVDVRSTMSPASKLTERDMIKPLLDVDILFIDDLGIRSKQETDFAYVTLYSLLNKRMEFCLPTVISSNKNIEQLGQSFDERIASRLQIAKQIEMVGKDRRKG